MTRVSLREAYDNKDVVAQIYAIRDIAESAEDTSEQAVTTANTASGHVDALVPQVEGAVANANSASASAQASAQTVAGYENRLATVESGLAGTESDLNAVTLRVTTAEGDIVTIQGRVTALETADGQNVKLTGEHAIGNYAVLLTGNQTKSGILTLGTANGLVMDTPSGYNILNIKAKGSAVGVDLKDTSNDINGLVADRRLISLRHFFSGGNYDAYWLEFLPRNNIVDKDSTKASGGLEFVVASDNEMTISLFAYNDSGTIVRKQLAKFMNGAWN